ncbi:MAG: hypothetical protein K0Q72_158 [Armatimonadetes bacterium]|jgi:hypothetical protein|nr:hypothetical protein [Armatimonadota bacterium]
MKNQSSELVATDARLSLLERKLTRVDVEARRWRTVASALAVALIVSLFSAPSNAAGSTASPSVVRRLRDIEALLWGPGPDRTFYRQGNNLYITGANLHIRSGAGQTNGVRVDPLDTNRGLGNLIIGYDEVDRGEGKKGSHNLVIGLGHAYTSTAGLVAGHSNAILRPNASVTGGYLNTASGDFSHVSGGFSSLAEGDRSSVSGGVNNRAAQPFTWIGGGENNVANGLTSAILGGFQRSTDSHRQRDPQ